jgi:photosystem II stability/assembly factor-like uncharacterized protein
MDKIEQLEKIKSYLDKGLIDIEEFNRLKSELLTDKDKLSINVKINSQSNNSESNQNKFSFKWILITLFILIIAIAGYFYFGYNNLDKIGYAVGSRGAIIKTSDGGSTWETIKSGTENNLNSVFFINKDIGYAVGDEGTIIKTIDGGDTWNTLKSGTTDPIGYVQFFNENMGFAVIKNSIKILKTIDGGKTWDIILMDDNDGRQLSSGFFIDEKSGFIVGCNGLIKKTNDGGKTWIDNKNISVVEKVINFTSPHGEVQWKALKTSSDIGFSSIYFLSNNLGYAVGGSIAGIAGISLDSYCAILKTTDGGASWIELESGIKEPLNSIYFIDENNGYATGFNGSIIKTSDGGITWSALKCGKDIEFTSTFFTDTNIGYIVGEEGTIIKTIDGGTTWVNLNSGKSNRLNSVFFLGKKNNEKQINEKSSNNPNINSTAANSNNLDNQFENNQNTESNKVSKPSYSDIRGSVISGTKQEVENFLGQANGQMTGLEYAQDVLRYELGVVWMEKLIDYRVWIYNSPDNTGEELLVIFHCNSTGGNCRVVKVIYSENISDFRDLYN